MRTKERVWLLVAVTCLGLLIPTAAPAAQDILELVPDDAFGFVVVNRLDQTDAKMRKVVELAELPVTETPLAIVKAFGGIDAGLDEKGRMALVVMPNDESPTTPKPVIILPVTDYDAFLKNFDPEKVTDTISKVSTADASALVAKKGQYAVFVESFNQELLESFLTGKKSIVEGIGPWKAWIGESDAVVVLSNGAVKLLVDMANTEIDNMKAMVEIMGQQGEQVKTALEAYQKILSGMRENLTYVGIAALVEKDHAVRLTARAQIKEGSPFGRLVADMKAPNGNRWTGIPNKPYAFAAAGSLSENLVGGAMQLSNRITQNMPNIYQLDERQMEKIGQLTAEAMKDVEGVSMHFGPANEGDPLYAGMTAALRVKDSGAFLKEYAKLVKSMAELTGESEESPLGKMTSEPTEFEGHKGLELSMDLAPLYDKPELAPALPLLKAMYGPESKLNVYMVAADKKTVVLSYVNKSGLSAAIRAATDADASLAADPAVGEMTKRLSPDAQWVGLWSLSGTFRVGQQVVTAMLPPDAMMTMPELADTPPIAFALKVSPTEAKKELLVPVQTLKQIVDLVKPFLAARMQVEEAEEEPEEEK